MNDLQRSVIELVCMVDGWKMYIHEKIDDPKIELLLL
jgi:hypothetical protein